MSKIEKSNFLWVKQASYCRINFFTYEIVSKID